MCNVPKLLTRCYASRLGYRLMADARPATHARQLQMRRQPCSVPPSFWFKYLPNNYFL